ncbi:PQQ-binding-like beta-propeller repeat protein [Streptomyces sp. NPDC048751]|uniref:outer membrane protein assembly factor BamB family protein n=1 Tax=Streptomyces sp. NPDC048751 TaxID=3365591 RepID=UPI0037199F18
MRFAPGRRARKAAPPGAEADSAGMPTATVRNRLGTSLRQGLLGETFKGRADDGTPVAVTRVDARWTAHPASPFLLEQAAVHARDTRVPGAVAVRGVLPPGDLSPDGFCLVTDFVAAPTLHKMVSHTGRLSVPLSLWLAESVAKVLWALAEDKRSHGALDPSTILCTASGPLLTDHSLIGPLSRAPRTQSLTGGVLSHPCFGLVYVAPEIEFRGEWGGTAADVYALGKILLNTMSSASEAGAKTLGRLVDDCTRDRARRRPSPQQVALRASAGLRETGVKPHTALAKWTSRMVRTTAAGRASIATVTTFGATRTTLPAATAPANPPAANAAPSRRTNDCGTLPPDPADVPYADVPQPAGQGPGELSAAEEIPLTAPAPVPTAPEAASAMVDHFAQPAPHVASLPDVTPPPDEPAPNTELPAAVTDPADAVHGAHHAAGHGQRTMVPGAAPSARAPRPSGWTTDLGFLPDAPLAYASDVLYVAGTDRGEGVLRALEGHSGTPLWEFRAGGPCQARPVPYRNRILLAARNGVLYSLRADDGQVEWSAPIDDPLGSAPAVVDDRVWLGGIGGTLQTVDLRDLSSRTVAVPGVPADVLASSALPGPGCLWMPTVTGLHRLAADGSVLWSRPELGDLNGCGIALAGDLLVGGTPDGRVYACDATSGEVLWTRSTDGVLTGPPLVAGGALYVGGSQGAEGAVWVHDPVSGHLLSVVALPTAVTSPLARGPGMVFVATRDRHLWAVAEGSGRRLWSWRVGGRIGRCGPRARGGLVFTGSSDCHLYAVAVRDGTGGPQGALRIDPEIDAALTVLFNRVG